MDYKSTKVAQEHLQRAMKATSAGEMEVFLKEGFAALRTNYEVLVLHDMFGSVVQRFDERVRIDLLRNAHVEPSLVEKVIEKYGYLSRFIEGHSHSDTFGAVKPTIDTLRKEISDFDALRAELRKAKNERKEAS